jgi:hypothetical protein
MGVVSGLGVTLSALVIQGVAGSLAIGAIDALFARRSVGTVPHPVSWTLENAEKLRSGEYPDSGPPHQLAS